MAKLLYSATMSLDGFIAGPGGDASWMTPYLGPNPAIDDVIGQIGALLVGHRTFGGDGPHKRHGQGRQAVQRRLKRLSLSQTPLATNLWLRVLR